MELKIKNKISQLEDRTEIKKKVRVIKEDQDSQVVQSREVSRYEYYNCDYCGAEIKVTNRKDKLTGGIVVLPSWITGRRELKLVLCNKCLNPVIEEFKRSE